MNITNMKMEEVVGRPFGMQYDLALSTDVIESAEEYTGFVNFCAALTEHDIVNLHITCLGGRVSTTSIIATAIENSRANFIAHLNSICWSGATVVALACDSWVVGDMVEFGLHSTQGGTGYSELSKVKCRTAAMERLNDLIDTKYYTGLLDADEIVRMKDGLEITFFKDELIERLQRYAQYRADKLAQQNNPEDLSQFSVEELEEEIQLCKEDIKAYQKEVKSRTSIQTRISTKTAKEA